MSNIIFLNGCSSSGKTTLAIKLQQLLEDPYQHIALDQFRDGMPMRLRGLNSPEGTPGSRGLNVVPIEKNGELVTSIEFGDYGEDVLSSMRRSIALFQNAGMNVIIDDLLFKSNYLEDYVKVLDCDHTWFIGVKCSLEIVKKREETRAGRFPGTATSHFEQVHEHGEEYDLEIDTSESSAREVAQKIIVRLTHPPVAFSRIRAAQS